MAYYTQQNKLKCKIYDPRSKTWEIPSYNDMSIDMPNAIQCWKYLG